MAGVTVAEILTLSALQGAYVTAGRDGLNRLVTGVNVMEVPDIEAFVKPGEILLTTGFPVHDQPERLVALVPELARQGLAALAIKPLRYLPTLPEQLVEAADRLRFPIIVMPDHTSFNDVIGAVLAVVLADYGADPARAEAIRERLTGVALSGGGLDGIAAALTAALDRDVTIVDEAGVLIGGHRSTQSGADESSGVDDGTSLGHDGTARTWSFPITVSGVVRGHVIVAGEGEPTLGQRRLIRQSCFAAAMHIAQALASMELDRKLRTLFLEEIVSGQHGDGPTIRQRSRLFGWDLAGEQLVLLAHCEKELADAQVDAAAHAALPEGALSWSRGSEVVAIVPTTNDEPTQARRRATRITMEASWQTALHDRGAGTTVVAVGSATRSPSELPSSHAAARDAIRIAQATGRAIVRHDDLVLERLLLANPSDELAQFVESQVGSLLRYDRSSGSDLCRTLEVYLGVGNGAEAARRLYIHYNTMKHRLQRIVDLTHADLHDPRTRLTLALALEARTLLRHHGRGP
jgi:purine catabolism regulator